MSVPEHREQGLAVAVIDRVIAPHAARDMPAVETEQLVQFRTREIQRAAREAERVKQEASRKRDLPF